jgi:chromosome segregation ATPase
VVDNASAVSRERPSLLDRLSEQVVLLERAFEEHASNQLRQAQAEAVQRDRERRTLSDLVHQVDVLTREAEATNSRVLALVEEVRREREARPPIVQAVDNLEREHATFQSRLSVFDQVSRRISTAQSVATQSTEQFETRLARVDDHTKLLELRLTRDLADIRQVNAAWRANGDEVLKPVAGLIKLVTALGDRFDDFATRQNLAREATQRLVEELNRLDGQLKADREEIGQLQQAIDSGTRRDEANGAAIWQVGARVDDLSAAIERVGVDARAVSEQLGELAQGLGQSDLERRRLETALIALESEQRATRRETVEQAERLGVRIDQELAALSVQADGRQRQAVDHLRRLTDAFQQQLRELETDLT